MIIKQINRRKKDWMLYIIGTVTLSVILFIGGWIGKNATFVLDNFCLVVHQIKDLDESIKSLKEEVKDNKQILADVRKNQEIIKLRQTKVIESLRVILKIHQLQDHLQNEEYKAAKE